MFRDLIRSPLSVGVRAKLPNPNDFDAVRAGFLSELERTRFLGLGTPAESGTHILYTFRGANDLQNRLFPDRSDLVTGSFDDPKTEWAFPAVGRLIFVDDFCGTGEQAARIGRSAVPSLRKVATRSGLSIDVWYLTMFATTAGLSQLRNTGVFDRVATVSELDDTYRVFSASSHLYTDPDADLKRADGQAVAHHYGELLRPASPLGYRDSQLLLGFHHNVPDNTLPIIWAEQSQPPWRALFPRTEKQP